MQRDFGPVDRRVCERLVDVTIRFPVLRRLSVSGYGLFQNENSAGIEHNFQPGVSLVIGINGLGKTTLLNMIYRALLGPRDMSKDDVALSSSQHKLSPWRNPRYFRARVPDEAMNASVTATVGFGPRTLVVGRSLRTLEVSRLELDGVAEDASQDHYEDLARELSGTATFFDFAAILRFLIFFLEDRPELVWDQRSQFDMLRVLFYDTAAARDAAEAYDQAQRADSNYRTRRVPVRAAEAQLLAIEAAEQTGLAQEMRATLASLNAMREDGRSRDEALGQHRAEEDDARLRREKALLDLEEARRAYEYEQQLHYAHVFPDIGETARHVFLNLLGGGGCLVCGDRSAAAATRVREFTEQGRCPVCESVPERQEHVVPSGEFNARRLARRAAKVDELRQGVSEQDALLLAAGDAVREIVAYRQASHEQVRGLEARMAELRRQAAPDIQDIALASDDHDLDFLRETVRKGQADLGRMLAERVAAETRYKAIKDSQATAVDAAISKVKASFRRIALTLLAERCELAQDEMVRTIGQEGERIAFPTFEVLMSSGTFTQSLSRRDEASSVSESQREFVDLAFRMALMEVAAGPEGNAMLVMETPEASLDSLFVTEAGALFRRFAAGGGAPGNVFIASTNLNSEGMIPALFGVEPPPGPEDADPEADDPPARPADGREDLPPSVPPEERGGRIVDLLRLAAPNAALRDHGAYYAGKLADAVYGDVPKRQRSRFAAPPAPPP